MLIGSEKVCSLLADPSIQPAPLDLALQTATSQDIIGYIGLDRFLVPPLQEDIINLPNFSTMRKRTPDKMTLISLRKARIRTNKAR